MYAMVTLEESFIAALRREIERLGYGAQKQLAEKLSVSRQHLNDILGERKTAGKRLQERIAQEYGFRYEDFLALGRMVLEGKPEEEIEKTASVLRQRPDAHQVSNEFPIGAQSVADPSPAWPHRQTECPPNMGLTPYGATQPEEIELLQAFRRLNDDNKLEALLHMHEMFTLQRRQEQQQKQESKK